MRGKKAKVLRLIAGYSVTSQRPQLPAGGWNVMERGPIRLPKDHPRRKYQFLKERYGMIPLGHSLKRSKATTAYVKAIGDAIQVREETEQSFLP
jgi:hypothetical protein